MTIDNLWDDLDQTTVTLPRTIIDRAIEPFNRKTHGMDKNLFFTLRIEKYSNAGDNITQSLYLCAPKLGGYSKLILEIIYKVNGIYPCVICNCLNPVDESELSCADENEFEQKLVSVLGSQELRTIISNLLPQC